MKLLNSIKLQAHSWLGARGYRVSKTSSPSELRQFLNLLRPLEVPLIRLGGNRDGGYLIPDDLSGIKFCFSPGVSDTANFEQELASKGVKSFLADFSVEHPPISDSNFSFQKKFVGPVKSNKMIVFEDWIRDNAESGQDLILQMDIEGAEYQTLLSCSDKVLSQFRVMVVEFHSLELLFDRDAFPVIKSCFEKILANFSVVHIHPNNSSDMKKIMGNQIPGILEITFLRKDRIKDITWAKKFPHELDVPNVPLKADVWLPRNWYDAIE